MGFGWAGAADLLCDGWNGRVPLDPTPRAIADAMLAVLRNVSGELSAGTPASTVKQALGKPPPLFISPKDQGLSGTHASPRAAELKNPMKAVFCLPHTLTPAVTRFLI